MMADAHGSEASKPRTFAEASGMKEMDPAWRAMILHAEDLAHERDELLVTLRETLSFQSLAEAVGSAPDLRSLLEAIATVVARVVPWKVLCIHGCRDGASCGWNPLLERGFDEGAERVVRGWVEDGIVEWVLESAKPVVLPPEDGGPSWLLVPMQVLGRPVGWLALLPDLQADAIAAHHLQTLRLVGSQAAATLDNLSQKRRIQESLAELESLYAVGSRIGSSLDLGEIFQAAADALVERFRPGFLQLAAIDAGHPPKVRALCVRGSARSDIGEDGLLLAACRQGEPLQSRRSLGANAELDALGLDLLVAVPFVHRGTTVLGGLAIGGASGTSLDSPGALNWLVALSGLLSASLENARLYDDLLGVNERLSEMQNHLVQAGRLAGVGQLAAGIAHEINNPLQVVMGRIQILQLRLAGHEKELEEVARIETETKRIARIVRGLQDFSHQSRDKVVREAVYLSEICESTLQLLDHRIRRNRIEVVRTGFDSVVRVEGDPDQLRQVVLNLCINAVQSMPEGGVLTVSLSKEGEYAVLEVQDTGAGIPPENVERVFDPFFTTKDEGIGLGLALSYAVCQRHGGTLELATRESASGCVFRVKLPTPV